MEKRTKEAIDNRPQIKGITLVSLVVTIIVLLILAGVTLALISGSNGILSKATMSVDKTNLETAKEQVTLKVGEHQSDFYEGKYVTQEIDNQKSEGTWIYENYEGKTTDFKFTITPPESGEVTSENPYIVTIEKNRKLPGKVTGTLSLDGILRWDDENPELPDSEVETGVSKTLYHVSGGVVSQSGASSSGTILMPNLEEVYNFTDGKALATVLSDKVTLVPNEKITLPKGNYRFESFVPVRQAAYGVGYRVFDDQNNLLVDHTYVATTENFAYTTFHLEETTNIKVIWYRTNISWTDFIYYAIKTQP